MKVIAYDVRDYEYIGFNKFSKELGIEVTFVESILTIENVHLTKGFDCVTIIGYCNASGEVLELMAKNGIKYIATRSIGYNHIDVKRAKELGIKVSNASYSPNSVAEFTIMLLLMLNRKAKSIIVNQLVHDYSFIGKMGCQVNNQTIGVVGGGRIGLCVIKALSCFGCKINVYDPYKNEEIKQYASYVTLDELFRTSDVITLHTPLTESTRHLINKDSISIMKDGVKIINCARGGLINTDDLIIALDSGKVGGAALDVIEDEIGIFHVNHMKSGISNKQIAILQQKTNVILSQHIAFFTDQATLDMCECSLRSLYSFKTTDESPWEINLSK